MPIRRRLLSFGSFSSALYYLDAALADSANDCERPLSHSGA